MHPSFPEEEEPVIGGGSEEEEDPDSWRDEFGRLWMRSAHYPGRWYLLGIGLDVDIIWEEPGWGSWGATWGEGASSGSSRWVWCWRVRLSGLPSYSEATKQPQCQAEPGVSVYGSLWKNYLFLVCTRCSHVKIGALFLFDLVSGSLFLGIWVLLVEYGTLDSSGDDFVRGCMFGSTADVGYCTYFLRCRGLES